MRDCSEKDRSRFSVQGSGLNTLRQINAFSCVIRCAARRKWNCFENSLCRISGGHNLRPETRNLLIYLNSDAQKQLMSLFHYALNDRGILFLGTAEAISGSEELFEMINGKNKIMKRRDSAKKNYPLLPPFQKKAGDEIRGQARDFWRGTDTRHLSRAIERMLLDQFVPCSATVNDQDTVIYFHGRLGNVLPA
jgi:hypothetical protein